MKWESDWWGITIIAESPNGEMSEDMKLIEELAEKLPVKTENCYEGGIITISDEFVEKIRVFKLIFNR